MYGNPTDSFSPRINFCKFQLKFSLCKSVWEVLCCHISLAIAVCFLYHDVYLLRRRKKKNKPMAECSLQPFVCSHSAASFFAMVFLQPYHSTNDVLLCNHFFLQARKTKYFFSKFKNNSDLGLQSSTLMRPLAFNLYTSRFSHDEGLRSWDVSWKRLFHAAGMWRFRLGEPNLILAYVMVKDLGFRTKRIDENRKREKQLSTVADHHQA